MRGMTVHRGLSGFADSWDWSTPDPSIQNAFVIEADTIAPGIVDYAKQIQSIGMSLIQAIAQARNTLSMSDAQRQLLDVQIDRAQRGLPPINTAQYVAGGSPLNQSISMQTVLLIGLGIFAVMALSKKG